MLKNDHTHTHTHTHTRGTNPTVQSPCSATWVMLISAIL